MMASSVVPAAPVYNKETQFSTKHIAILICVTTLMLVVAAICIIVGIIYTGEYIIDLLHGFLQLIDITD